MSTEADRTEDGVVSSNGIEIWYEIGGSGPPLLLIGGLGRSSSVWSNAIGQLRHRFRVVVFDNRGTGKTSVPGGPYTIDMMADDAAGLLDGLNISTTHAVGWSLGGSILQSLMIRHGNRLRSAVLLNAFPNYTALQHAWLDATIALRRSDASPEAKATLGLPWGLTAITLSDHDLTMKAVAAVDPMVVSHAAYEAQAAGVRVYDSRARLPEVKTPTLVIAGAEDILTPVAQSVEIANLVPGAQLRVLGKGGHRMIVEYPNAVLSHIVAYLAAAETHNGPNKSV